MVCYCCIFTHRRGEKEKNVETQSSLVGGGEKSLCRRAQKRLLKISEQKKRRGIRLFSPICSQSSWYIQMRRHKKYHKEVHKSQWILCFVEWSLSYKSEMYYKNICRRVCWKHNNLIWHLSSSIYRIVVVVDMLTSETSKIQWSAFNGGGGVWHKLFGRRNKPRSNKRPTYFNCFLGGV